MGYRTISVLIVCSALVWPQLSAANNSGKTNFIYPLGSWYVTTHQGDSVGSNLYHMGVDVGSEYDAGTPVYAVADGIVKEAQERTQFGLVVLIEHSLTNGSKVVSQYGHLDPTDIRVTPGQTVTAGDIIGVLGTTDNNGGWPVHLHFGIHKDAYTGEWVYYGHVLDPTTAQYWYDPEKFIPKHLTTDHWKPYVNSNNLFDGDVIGNSPLVTFQVGDIGSGIKKARLQIKSMDTSTWNTLVQTNNAISPITQMLDVSNYSDGPIKFRYKIRDNFNNVRLDTITVTKNPQLVDQAGYVTMSGDASPGTVRVWSFHHNQLSSFNPFGDSWDGSGDLTTGDINGDGDREIITVSGSDQSTILNIVNQTGEQLGSFTPFAKQVGRVATTDLTSDGKDEIIVAAGDHQPASVKAFTASGELLWEQQPFGDTVTTGLDITTGDVTGDGMAEIIVSTRPGTKTRVAILNADGSLQKTFAPFKADFTGGVNVTSGDINADGKADIIVGTASQHIGTVRLLSNQGDKLGISFYPFGDQFTGSVDVAISSAGLLVSQAGHGQAWVKVYNTDSVHAVLSENLAYDGSFEGGTRITSWN